MHSILPIHNDHHGAAGVSLSRREMESIQINLDIPGTEQAIPPKITFGSVAAVDSAAAAGAGSVAAAGAGSVAAGWEAGWAEKRRAAAQTAAAQREAAVWLPGSRHRPLPS